MEFEEDIEPAAVDANTAQPTPQIAPEESRHVAALLDRIREDELHHKAAFDRMRRDMRISVWGHDKDWPKDSYSANIIGRHINRKVAALYAKNPRIVARRRPTLDFRLWDESPESLAMAQQIVAMAPPPAVDPITGLQVPPPLDAAVMQAQQLMQDFQQGMLRRSETVKLGKTLETLFAHAMQSQQPLDFKGALKKVVRRACVTGVAYVKAGYERITESPQSVQDQMNDHRERIAKIEHLMAQAQKPDANSEVELQELRLALEALQQRPHVVVREGLVFDYPLSTNVVPDKLTREISGFVGANHLTICYYYPKDVVEARFKVDLGTAYKEYTIAHGGKRAWPSATEVIDEDYPFASKEQRTASIVKVMEHYDRSTGLVYTLADGYKGYLTQPSAPNVFVEGFFPLHALTFNPVESDDEVFPPSDVSLLLHPQREYNRARQGLREHRDAARPRYVYAAGSFNSEQDAVRLSQLRPFESLGLNLPPGFKIGEILQPLPIPSPDPNLYDTGPLFSDVQFISGSQEALFGGIAQATATESSIAASATQTADGANVDELDGFLTRIARDAGVILLTEMPPEQVEKIVGPGFMWPGANMQTAQAVDEVISAISLEIEAGSTGRPNSAVEVNNMQTLAPFLLQIPGINPAWLAKEMIRRMDDRVDITEALLPSVPSIVSMNQNAQPGFADGDPNAQGAEGADNTQTPQEPSGTGPAFGSNQV